MDLRLCDVVAIVGGASARIGHEFVRTLAEENALAVMSVRREPPMSDASR